MIGPAIVAAILACCAVVFVLPTYLLFRDETRAAHGSDR